MSIIKPRHFSLFSLEIENPPFAILSFDSWNFVLFSTTPTCDPSDNREIHSFPYMSSELQNDQPYQHPCVGCRLLSTLRDYLSDFAAETRSVIEEAIERSRAAILKPFRCLASAIKHAEYAVRESKAEYQFNCRGLVRAWDAKHRLELQWRKEHKNTSEHVELLCAFRHVTVLPYEEHDYIEEFLHRQYRVTCEYRHAREHWSRQMAKVVSASLRVQRLEAQLLTLHTARAMEELLCDEYDLLRQDVFQMREHHCCNILCRITKRLKHINTLETRWIQAIGDSRQNHAMLEYNEGASVNAGETSHSEVALWINSRFQATEECSLDPDAASDAPSQ